MDLGTVSLTLVLLVLLALAFDFMNGFHDAANSIATIVSTGVLKPWQAVLWASAFNVLAWAVFNLTVAATVGKNIIDPGFVDNQVIRFQEMAPMSAPKITGVSTNEGSTMPLPTVAATDR